VHVIKMAGCRMNACLRLVPAVLLAIAAFAHAAGAQTTKVTFVLVNDIYQMSEQILPDGKARGGFARLAAVVKA